MSSHPGHELSRVGDGPSWVEPGYVGPKSQDEPVKGDPVAKSVPAAERVQSPSIDPAADAGNRFALEVLNLGVTNANRTGEVKTDTGPDGILLSGAALTGIGLGAAMERPRYALGAVAAAVTIDLGRRLFVAGTSAWDAYRNPQNRDADNQRIAGVFRAESLKYPAELGFAALAGVGLGRLGRAGLATTLARLPRIGVPETADAARATLPGAAELRIGPDGPAMLTSINSQTNMERRAQGILTAADEDAGRRAASSRETRIMDNVFREKVDQKGTVAIPIIQGDELEFKPNLIYADPKSGLGLFYETMRRPVAKIISEKTGPVEPGELARANSSGFFISDTLGVSNKHTFAGFDRVVAKSIDGHAFPATVVAVDHDADLLIFRLLNKPADVATPYFKLAASSELPKGSFAVTINHVTGTSEDVLAMGQIRGNVLTRSPKNNPEGRFIGRVLSDVSLAGGGSGSELLNQSGEVIGVNFATVGRASFATRVEHLQIMKGLVERQPPPPGHYYVLTTTFDQSSGQVRVVRIETSTDNTLGGQQGDATSWFMKYPDLDTENFVSGESQRAAETLKRREAARKKP